MNRQGWIGSILLIVMLVAAGSGLAAWKYSSIQDSAAASAHMPEPMESISVAAVAPREFRQSTTSIGTVMALRSITLQNELAGTVREVRLDPGQIVETGTVLVKLDVSVEEAELKEQQARAALAESMLNRMESVGQNRAISQAEVDRAKAEYDVAVAQVERTKAVIARKTIRAPFRARVGISDVHVGQYLTEGSRLTTLQGTDEAVYVDFAVTQQVAGGLRPGSPIQIYASSDSPIPATIQAVDARVDPTTRNAMVRALINKGEVAPAPGASVRVEIPVGAAVQAAVVPVSALRKDPTGEHVFVLQPDSDKKLRAHVRMVQSGPVLGDDVLILAGLKAGEQVAAAGSFKLREGSLVAIAENPGAQK